MHSIQPLQPSDDRFDAILTDIDRDLESEIDSAWEAYCSEHISPSRLAQISVEDANATQKELSHLEFCDNCRTHFEEYIEVSNSSVSESIVQPTQRGVDNCRAPSIPESGHKLVDATHLTEAISHSVPALIADTFLADSPILFPGGEVARHSWLFGLSATSQESDRRTAKQAFVMCCDELFAAIQAESRIDLHNAMFVCFGEAMHECGVELATRVVDSICIAPHVVLAHDYYNPKLVCDSREFQKADVVVLVDVVHSGSLLSRLTTLCSDYGPSTVTGLALIDQSASHTTEMDFLAIWNAKPEAREPLDEFRATASSHDLAHLRVFDPNRSCAIQSYLDSPPSLQGNGTPTIPEASDVIDAQLQDCIARTDAMKRDFTIGDKKYAFAVNVLDLLRKDDKTKQFVLGRAYNVLADCAFNSTCLAYHAGRSRRAGVIAKALSDITGWPTMSLGTTGNTFSLTNRQCQQFASYDNVVIVDAAMRTGDTIGAIAQAIANEKVMSEPRVLGFCILNSLTDIELESLSQKLNIELRSAFRLPLAPPSNEIRHWTSLQKALVGKELIEHCSSDLVREVLVDYCLPRLRKGFSRSSIPSEQLAAVLREAIMHARQTVSAVDKIASACSSRSPSVIRHLEVNDVINDRTVQSMLNGIMFNSMKPQFKESAAIALAVADRYEWMTLKWLKVNEEFLSSRGSAWKAVVMIEQLMAMSGREKELKAFRDAAMEYRDFRETEKAKRKPIFTQRSLFSDNEDDSCSTDVSENDVVSSRLDTYIEAAQV